MPGTGNGAQSFATKALITLLGVFTASLLAFFVWLATAIIDVRERVVRIESSVASLLDTRTTQAAETSARSTRRIEQLEKDRGIQAGEQ